MMEVFKKKNLSVNMESNQLFFLQKEIYQVKNKLWYNSFH
jgi:hypothetical protein